VGGKSGTLAPWNGKDEETAPCGRWGPHG